MSWKTSLLLGLLLTCGLSATEATADELPSALSKVPLESAIFSHIWIDDGWKHPTVKAVRAKAKDMIKEVDQDYQVKIGVKISELISMTTIIPKLMDSRDLEQNVVILTCRQPYDREAIKKSARPDAPPFDGPGFLALDRQLVAHFTSPTILAIMHRNLAPYYLKWQYADEQGALKEAVREAASRNHLATVAVNLPRLPAEAFPDQYRVFMHSKTLVAHLDATPNSLEATITIDGGREVVTRGVLRALESLLNLADEGLQIAKKKFDNHPDPETKQLLQAMLDYGKAIHRSTKITSDKNRVMITAKLALDDSTDETLVGLIKDYRRRAASISSQNNLKQLTLAVINYADTYNGSVPPAIIMDKRGKPLLSWRVTILPYIGEEELYKQFKLDEPWDSEHNKKLLAKMPKVFDNPRVKNDDDTLTHYRVFVGPDAGFDRLGMRKFPRDYLDGTSNTIMVIEAAQAVPWTKPEPLEYDPKLSIDKLRAMFLFKHGRCNVGLFDGSVRVIKESISEPTMRRAITRNDGLPLLADWNQ